MGEKADMDNPIYELDPPARVAVMGVISAYRLARLLLPILRTWPDLWDTTLPPAWDDLTDLQKKAYVDAVMKMQDALKGVARA